MRPGLARLYHDLASKYSTVPKSSEKFRFPPNVGKITTRAQLARCAPSPSAPRTQSNPPPADQNPPPRPRHHVFIPPTPPSKNAKRTHRALRLSRIRHSSFSDFQSNPFRAESRVLRGAVIACSDILSVSSQGHEPDANATEQCLRAFPIGPIRSRRGSWPGRSGLLPRCRWARARPSEMPGVRGRGRQCDRREMRGTKRR